MNGKKLCKQIAKAAGVSGSALDVTLDTLNDQERNIKKRLKSQQKALTQCALGTPEHAIISRSVDSLGRLLAAIERDAVTHDQKRYKVYGTTNGVELLLATIYNSPGNAYAFAQAMKTRYLNVRIE